MRRQSASKASCPKQAELIRWGNGLRNVAGSLNLTALAYVKPIESVCQDVEKNQRAKRRLCPSTPRPTTDGSGDRESKSGPVARNGLGKGVYDPDRVLILTGERPYPIRYKIAARPSPCAILAVVRMVTALTLRERLVPVKRQWMRLTLKSPFDP